MKVILSRKGFDSESGGYASPILPNGRLLSLPIPNTPDSTRYCELKLTPSMTYYDLMQDLNKKKYIKYKAPGDNKSQWHSLELDTECHLDPDIFPSVIERHKDWRPLFGQRGAAQTVLDKHNIQKGDIFLFFGRFKMTKNVSGKLQFDPSDRDRHVIFGYFQIDEKILVSKKLVFVNGPIIILTFHNPMEERIILSISPVKHYRGMLICQGLEFSNLIGALS